MATITSIASGYWSNPQIWDSGTVPADGDSVIVATGHTVTFDVDQSNFANGLAGLTINGTLKIPSQAEDPNMPNTVVLKVNANIAGSGSFLIGSPDYPITYPQRAQVMLNGGIVTAIFNAYGERRSPLWDYLAQDSHQGSYTIVLQNGLPLRAGDLIAIGRSDVRWSWGESPGERGAHTVAAYDPQTKTVTLNEPLTQTRSGTGARACLVVLLTRQIVITKYGNVYTAAIHGSGRTVEGVLFQHPDGAVVWSSVVAHSSTFNYCAHAGWQGNAVFFGGSNYNIDHHTGFTSLGNNFTRSIRGTNAITNSALINSVDGILWAESVTASLSLNNVHSQNSPVFDVCWGSIYNITQTIQNCVIKNASRMCYFSADAQGSFKITISDVLLVDTPLCCGSPIASLTLSCENLTVYYFLTNYDYYPFNWSSGGQIFIKNANIQHSAAGKNAYLAYGNAATAWFVGCSISGVAGQFLGFQNGGCKFINCSVDGANGPLINNQSNGISEIINLGTNAYYRPTLFVPDVPEQLWMNRVIVKGLTVAGTQYPYAFEHIFPHGYAKNRWDASTPDYQTFDFYLTQSQFAGQPIWLEAKVMTSQAITVAGTITQLGQNESVKVQIFRETKEPLYGDTPDYEQTYTAAGDINISWTPPSYGQWIIRILTYPQQTTNPITIAKLLIAGVINYIVEPLEIDIS